MSRLEVDMWKDTTSYSRDEPKIPKAWSIIGKSWRLTVVTGHIYYPGEWIMHFHPFFTEVQLKVQTEQEAKRKAISLAGQHLAEIFADFDKRTKP